MAYSVVQAGTTSPSMEQLETAFQQVPGLTVMDVRILGRDAYGILVKGIEQERASALQSALATQGVETEVVGDEALPELPAPRHLNKAAYSDEGFLIYDLMGRGVPLPWNEISIIAAGRARLTEFHTQLTEKVLLRSGHRHWDAVPEVRIERDTKEVQQIHLPLEIVTHGAAQRYHTIADKPETLLLFQCLGERRTRDPLKNLSIFVKDLAQFAPNAVLTYGAYNLCENGDPSFTYASKTAFYREITWLLWMMATGRTASQ